MFRRISNSWELVKASAGVLSSDKELLIFPVISSIGVLIITALFVVPFLVSNLFDSLFSQQSQIFGYLVLFLYYIVQYTIIFFANTALVGAAMIRIRGGDPTIGDGLQIAAKHFGSILGYALIAATVGMILRWIGERSKGLGRIVVSLVGMAWNIGTYLVVPVLAVEGVGPIEAIKRSVNYLKKTWGEQIIGNLGIGAVTGLAFFIVFAVGAVLVGLAFTLELSIYLIIIIGFLTVIVLILLGLVSSALNGIYTAAVYQYAATGESGKFFKPEMVQNAFRLKG